MRNLLAVFLLTCSVSLGLAQQALKWPPQAGFSLAGISYTGDYTEGSSALSRVYPGGNFSLQSANPRPLKLQMNAGFGKFAEQYDTQSPTIPDGAEIPTFIETSFLYGDLRLKYHFFHQKKFQPYLSAGAGIMFFNPKDQDGKKLIRRTSTRLEGEDFNAIIPELPLSGGIHVHLSRQIWLDVAYTYRYTPTDYLDNLGLAGQNNGFDALHSVQLGLHFTLGPKPEAGEMGTNLLAEAPVEQVADLDSSNLLSDQIPVPDSTIAKPVDLHTHPLEEQEDREEDVWQKKAEVAIENGDFIYHQVKKGETVESLSAKFHVSSALIKQLNFIQSDKLKKGSTLRIPDIGND